jgi:hypothetical protein
MFLINAQPQDGFEKTLLLLTVPFNLGVKNNLPIDPTFYIFAGQSPMGPIARGLEQDKANEMATSIYGSFKKCIPYHDIYGGPDPVHGVIPVPWSFGTYMVLVPIPSPGGDYISPPPNWSINYKDGFFYHAYNTIPLVPLNTAKLDYDKTISLLFLCVCLGVPFFDFNDMEANHLAILTVGDQMYKLPQQPRDK